MRFRQLALTCALLACVLAPGPSAHADWPPPEDADLSSPANWPSDPGYAGQWNLWSFVPAEVLDQISTYEAMVGSGIAADRAWRQTIGHPAIVIAELDSGIRWRERDLVNKFYLNRGELPVPQAACGTGPNEDPHDANGDGLFNVQDYTTATGHEQPDLATVCDTRVSDMNGNGFLDPQDLIRLFSDDTDADANGWIDDIAGWDAFHDDNDPADDTDFGHGTGEANDSAGEADNGMGDAGVCPRCLVMPVRVGDSFVVEANDFATGVIFGVDAGAQIIQEALGSINATPAAYAAIEYAYARDVVVVASAADEDSFHANQPGSVNHTLYVHAVRYDSNDLEDATTFMAFNNCTNYGAQLLLSTPGTGCSSEATGKTAGAVGLILSAGLEAGLDPPLKPEEVKQLLLTTVDDIYDAGDATNPDRYITYPGWEKRFGYGRTNVARAVEAVFANAIPPVVDVWTPEWFATVDPDSGEMVSITGELSFRAGLYDSMDYVVEWAPGIEPTDDDFTEIASETGVTAPVIGELARVAARDLEVDNPPMPEPDLHVNRYMVTVRVRVTLHSSGAQDGTAGEIRRAFHVHRDPSLVDGFPKKLGGSGEGSAKVSDLDGDGAMEIVYSDASGTVWVLGASGAPRPGWPVQTDVIPAWAEGSAHRNTAAVTSGLVDPDTIRTPAEQGPAVGDLDGDGTKEIVVASWDGYLYVWDAGGALADGFPVELDRARAADTTPSRVLESGVFGSPVLFDLDGDEDLEIVVAAMDGHVYVWHHDGSRLAPFPVPLKDGDQDARIVQTPSIGDITGDGAPEIVVGTNELYAGLGRLYALHADGTVVDGWPIRLPTQDVLPVIGVGLPNNTALADVDRDGVLDVAATGIVSVPHFVRGDTSIIGLVQNSPIGALADVDNEPGFIAVANGSFGDLDNDGAWDVVWPSLGAGYAQAAADGGKRVDFDHGLSVWSSKTKTFLPGFPRRMDDHQFFMNASVADLDDDGNPEAIAGSGGYYLHAFDRDGVEPEGWPKFTGGWIISSPAVGDLDGDGTLEVVAATREGWLYAWHTTGRVDGRVDWASFHHDDHNTGSMATSIGFGRGPSSSGGCCDAGGGSPGGALLLAFAVALTVGRRSPRGGRAASARRSEPDRPRS